MENFKETISFIIERFPSNAIDISESLELLKDTIDETITSINKENNKAMEAREFTVTEENLHFAKNLYHYEQQIDKVIEMLEVESTEEVNESDELEEIEKNKIPDYEAYVVDMKVEHTLYEDFTHKRPHAFRINKDNIIEVQSWKDMLIKTCELLGAIDESKLLSFEDNPKMNGKRRKYFSTKKSELRKPGKLNSIYIETNINSNGIRNLIVKMLQQYDFKISELKVFLRADYTDLHN